MAAAAGGQEEGFESLPVKIPITFLSGNKRESARAMGFEEELEGAVGLGHGSGVRKARSMNPLSVDGVGAGAKRGRRGLGESGGSLGSRVEAKDRLYSEVGEGGCVCIPNY